MKDMQKVGGVTFVVLIALLLTVASQGYVPGSDKDPAKALN